jgi:hypothetical protein
MKDFRSARKHLLRVTLCLIVGALVTFFTFGIVHNDGNTFASGVVNGLMWTVFGFAKRGIVNTSVDGQIVYHNLWPYILSTSSIFLGSSWLWSVWRAKSKSRNSS